MTEQIEIGSKFMYYHYNCHNDEFKYHLVVIRKSVNSITVQVYNTQDEPIMLNNMHMIMTLKNYKNKGWFQSRPIGFECSSLTLIS